MPHHEAGTELAALLPEITGPSGQFRHRQHIHLAFLAVRRYGMPEATTRICDWIQCIAAYERAPQKYHHTLTMFWVFALAALRGMPDARPCLSIAKSEHGNTGHRQIRWPVFDSADKGETLSKRHRQCRSRPWCRTRRST